VKIYLNLYPELLDRIEQEKQPSASVIPDIQASFNEGVTDRSNGVIGIRFFFKSVSLKAERKVTNLAFLVGNTIFPLNNKHIGLSNLLI